MLGRDACAVNAALPSSSTALCKASRVQGHAVTAASLISTKQHHSDMMQGPGSASKPSCFRGACALQQISDKGPHRSQAAYLQRERMCAPCYVSQLGRV